jgi:hypothetical protein
VVDIMERALAKDLDTKVLDQDADVYVVCAKHGIVISKSPSASGNVFAYLDEFDEINASFNFDSGFYGADDVHDNEGDSRFVYSAPLTGGGILTASPVPLPSVQGDPDYRPNVYVVQKISSKVFGVVYSIEESIDADVQKNTLLSVFLGIFGFAVVMLILAVMSNVITKPLNWITEASRRVINKDFKETEGNNEAVSEERGDSFIGFDDSHKNTTSCAPQTELRQLVVEFQRMIHSFSGDGACKVAEPALFQIKNEMTWHSDFSLLYSRDGPSRKSFRQVSVSTETSQTETLQMLNDWTLEDTEQIQDDENTNRQKPTSQRTASPPIIVVDNEDQTSTLSIGFVGNGPTHNEPEDINLNEEGDCDHSSFRIHKQQPLHSREDSDNGGSGVWDMQHQMKSDSKVNEHNQQLYQRGRDPEGAPGRAPEVCGAHLDWSGEPQAPKISHPGIVSANVAVPAGSRRISFASLPHPNQSGGAFSVIPAPVKINRAPVLGAPKSMTKPMLKEAEGANHRASNVCCSALFWWIVLLMALPVLLTNTIIAAVASSSIMRTIPAWVGSAEIASSSIETDGLRFLAHRKASVLSSLAQGTFRDIHFMARISGWLVFGGVKRSGTLTDVDTAT